MKKEFVTRRDFVARASRFLALAGLSPALKPFVWDMLVSTCRAEEGPSVNSMRSFFFTDRGGLPWTTYAAPHLIFDPDRPSNLSYYEPGSSTADVTGTDGGSRGNLILPGAYGDWPSWLKNRTMTYFGDRGTGGHSMPGRSSHLTDGGDRSSPWLLNARRQTGFMVSGVEFRSRNQQATINNGLDPSLEPQAVNVGSMNQTQGNLASLFSPVEFVSLDRTREVPVLKAVLNAMAYRFGEKRVATERMKAAIKAQETGGALLTRNLADLVSLDADTLAAYNVGDEVRNVEMGKILAFTEKLFVNGLTGNVAYATSTGDWHYRPDTGDMNESVFRMQRQLSSQISVFMDRLSRVEDPMSPGRSVADSLHFQLSSYQTRSHRNNGGWGDTGNHVSLVINPNVKAGTYGGVASDGSNRQVEQDGSMGRGDGDPKRFLNTIYRAMRLDERIGGAGVVQAALKAGV